MNKQHQFFHDASFNVGIVDTPRGLSSINDPKYAAVIWRRQPLLDFTSWIDAMELKDLPKARIILRPEVVRNAMKDLVKASRLPDCVECNMLVDDVAALANIFAAIMKAEYLKFNLDVVKKNVCTKFERNQLTAGLICTYRGPGTEYGNSVNGEDPHEICDVSSGSPIILRGDLWPGSQRSRLLHRSPLVADSSQARLVLKLEPIENLNGQTNHQLFH